MNKIYSIALLFCISTTSVFAAESVKENLTIKDSQRKVALEIFELRKSLIQTDPKLLKLHKEKLKIHRQISERISGNTKMAALIEEAIKLQAQLDEINAIPVLKKEISTTEKTVKLAEKDTNNSEPEYQSRNQETRTEVVDKTSDAHLEEDEEEGLSYE